MKKYRNTILIMSSLSVIFMLGLLFTTTVYAGFGSLGGSYFGGKVVSKIPCTCNVDGGFQLTLTGPMSSVGTYLENTQTKIYGRGMISVMSNLLGKTTMGGVCMVGVQPYCTALPITKGTISYTGLSGF